VKLTQRSVESSGAMPDGQSTSEASPVLAILHALHAEGRLSPVEVARTLEELHVDVERFMPDLQRALGIAFVDRVLQELAPIKRDLRDLTSAWFGDDEAILRRLARISEPERALVLADPALMAALGDALDHAAMKVALDDDHLRAPLVERLRLALGGWGTTDETYLFASIESASSAEIRAAAEPVVRDRVDADLSGEELDRWRGTLARGLVAAGDPRLAFQQCLGDGWVRRARLQWIGDRVAQRRVLDEVIATDDERAAAAFESYWDDEAEAPVETVARLPLSELRVRHDELRGLPDAHARRPLWNRPLSNLAPEISAVDPLGGPTQLTRLELHVAKQFASGVVGTAVSVAQAWDIGAAWINDALGTSHGNAGELVAAPLTELTARRLAPDPALADSFLATTLPRTFGNLLAFIATGGAAGAAGGSVMATNLLVGAAAGGASQFQAAQSKGADLTSARAAFTAGLLLGLTDAVPVGRMLDRLDQISGGAATRLILGFVRTGTEELMQEFLQTFADSVIARVIYDENQTLGGAVHEALESGAAAGISSMLFHLVAMVVRPRVRVAATAPTAEIPQLDAGRVEAPQLEAPQLEAPQLAQREAPQSEAPQRAAPQPEAGVTSSASPDPSVRATPSVVLSAAALREQTITEFVKYTRSQADWSLHDQSSDRVRLQELLQELLRDPAVAYALGPFRVEDVLAIDPSDRPALQKYADGVHSPAARSTAKLAPVDTLARAVELGRVVPRLEAAVGGGGVLYHITAARSVEHLIDAGRVDEFVAYAASGRPQWNAENGSEIRSFLLMPPGFFPLVEGLPDMRNPHHFELAALQRLMSDRAGGGAPGRPLSVIIHSGMDHNAAFHHDPQLTAAIVDNPNRVIMIEGEETLGAIEAKLEGLAAAHGAPHVEQLMLAGHGQSRRIKLAGRPQLGEKRGNPAVVAEMSPLDLDENAEETARFCETVMSVMGGTESRIVLNACLTASNAISIDPAGVDPQEQIQTQLRERGSLANAVRAIAGATGPQVVGANASFPTGASYLDDRGRFDIMWPESATDEGDPALTATDRLEYIRHGREPVGVVRAVVERWAPPIAGQAPWLSALEERLGRPSTTWNGDIITAALHYIRDHASDASAIAALVPSVHEISHVGYYADAHVEGILKVLPEHRDALFSAVTQNPLWASRPLPPIAIYQVWGRSDRSKLDALVAHLDAVTLSPTVVQQRLDWGFLAGDEIAYMLPLERATSPSPGQLRIACANAVSERPAPAAIAFLRAATVGGEFPSQLRIAELSGSEDAVLAAIGLGSNTTTTARDANIDADRDGINEQWVERTARFGIAHDRGEVRVHAGPAASTLELGMLRPGQRVFIHGTVNGWCAIELDGQTGYVEEPSLVAATASPAS
jgi:hypothetical protein